MRTIFLIGRSANLLSGSLAAMKTCSTKARRRFTVASAIVLAVAILAATLFVNMPSEELRPVIIGMAGGAVIAQAAIALCRSFRNTALWFGAFTALIVIATAIAGYRDEAKVLTSFVLTGTIIIAAFGLNCKGKKTP